MLPTVAFWTWLGFVLGSMPFSVWLGRCVLHTDIRLHGDGNPGATNAWRAGGWRIGLPAAALDYLKAAIPVTLAHFHFGVKGWGLVVVALAPVLGHAFSPFLRFRGGKALAATFGIWTGLTIWEAPTALGVFFALFLLLQTVDGWAVVFGMLCLLPYLVLRGFRNYTWAVWCGNLLILVWKHRRDLREVPRIRPSLLRLLRGNG